MKPVDFPRSVEAHPWSAPPQEDASSRPQARSLFGEILDWMLAPLLLVWPASIALTYLVASSIANGPFDHALESSARVLANQVRYSAGEAAFVLPIAARDLLRADGTDRIYFQVRGSHGELLGGDADLGEPPEDEAPVGGAVQLRKGILRGEPVRIAATAVDVPAGGVGRAPLVQVAETLDKRNQLAGDIVKGVILPQFVIVPVAVVLVWLGLSRGIRPLSLLQQKVQDRAPNDMRPIDPREAPEEVAPLVAAFNQLLARLETNIQDQKRFIADAAHQMRTPLAGLRTQAELALREDNRDELRRSLRQLATSSDRATRLVNQLLSLARAEDRFPTPSGWGRVDLEALARDVTQDWVPLAMDRQTDLGFEGIDAPIIIEADAVFLRELLKNLLDNALRYTPSASAVTVRVGLDDLEGAAMLVVEDNGPGIAEEERQLVFERFYRILGSNVDGSGLGLAIVREIAQRHGARIDLGPNPNARLPGRPGVRISVLFPHRSR